MRNIRPTMRSVYNALALVFGLSISSYGLAEVNVSPPNWWAGMQSTKLQLMLHGENIGELDARVEHSSIEIVKQTRTDNSNYLFLDLYLSDTLTPGMVPIYLGNDVREYVVNYEFEERQQNSQQRQGFSAKDVIYLITPDRFANGDPHNDNIKGYADKLDRRYKGGRHGGDIQGIINHLDYIEDMGFTQIWTMPLLENAMERYSYHGYSTTNYFEIDPRFGSNALFRQLSRAAKKQGIGVIKDVVLNHIGSNHLWMSDMPANDWVNHGTNFVQTTHRREALHDPHAVQDDIEAFASGWFVPTMPDLNQRNSHVAEYLIQYAIWWIEYAELSGLRVDTYSYSDKAFLSEWTKRVMAEYPNINIVGEEWTTNPAITAYWQKGSMRHDDYESELPSVMDFPFQVALANALKNPETWATGLRQLYEVFATDFLYGDPYKLVIFGDNHDMSRVMTQYDDNLEHFKMALATILTARGIPQVFYGTEIGMSHPGTDDHGLLRADFPGGWVGDKVNAFTEHGLNVQQVDIKNYVKTLLNFRKASEAITSGQFTHYAPDNGVYVYFRHSEADIVMVVINKNNQSTELDTQRFSQFVTQGDTLVDVITGATSLITAPLTLTPMTTHVFSLQKQ